MERGRDVTAENIGVKAAKIEEQGYCLYWADDPGLPPPEWPVRQ